MLSIGSIKAEVEITEEKVDVSDGVWLNFALIISVIGLDFSQDALSHL